MKSPFKFLDAYTSEDRDVFFGREEEIAALYDMVTKNRLILVYGQSGTGKTSLIQCGLASRFDTTDWLPLFIRRQDDLNLALEQRLFQIAGLTNPAALADILDDIYVAYLRPVYLIFDQLEELFILGSMEEQNRFIKTIKSILDSNVPCRILFVMREEYLAFFFGFERTIPTLFDRRLRVEPMGVSKVQEVLRGSFKPFNITVQPPAEQSFDLIIDNVSGGKTGIQLPYLQVYLDMLYRDDYARTYPGQEPQAGVWQPVEITRAEIQALGKIENVLEKFLREQQERLQAELEQKFPGSENDAVKKVLDAFVSEEGTKRPVGYKWKGELLRLEPRLSGLFEPLHSAVVTHICRALEQARLLRFADTHIELAHDALAALIDNQRTAQQRRVRDAHNRLHSAFREYHATGECLSRRQLNSLEDVMPLLEARLNPEIKAFVQESYRCAEAQEQAELVAERRKRRRNRRIAIAGLGLATVALIAFFVALNQYRAAARNAAAARRNVAMTLKVEGRYGEALAQLSETEQFAHVLPASERQEILQMRNQWQQVEQLINAGDSLAALEDLRNAISRYQSAQNIATDAHIDNLVTQTQKDLEVKFAEYLLHGEALMNAKKYPRAAERFEKALLLKPDDAGAKRLLQESRRLQPPAN